MMQSIENQSKYQVMLMDPSLDFGMIRYKLKSDICLFEKLPLPHPLTEVILETLGQFCRSLGIPLADIADINEQASVYNQKEIAASNSEWFPVQIYDYSVDHLNIIQIRIHAKPIQPLKGVTHP
jgi:hypothetical protein